MAQVAQPDATAAPAIAAISPIPAIPAATTTPTPPPPQPDRPLSTDQLAPTPQQSVPPNRTTFDRPHLPHVQAHNLRPPLISRDPQHLYPHHPHQQSSLTSPDLSANNTEQRFHVTANHTALTPEQQPLITTPQHSPLHQDPASSTQSMMPIVNTFADMTLGATHMHYPTPVPLVPIQPQPIVPLVAPHHPSTHAHMPHPRHSSHPSQTHLLPNQATTHGHWVPKDRVGSVIGSHGTVIRSLQEKSGATIQVHNETIQAGHKLFTIHGLPAQIETAIQLIIEIVELPHSMSSAGSDRASNFSSRYESSTHPSVAKTVFVPTSCVGLVIGRSGETIRRLQDKSGAEIKVTPDEDSSPVQHNRPILLTGSEDAIATAQQLVSELVRDARSRRQPSHGSQPHMMNPPHVEVLSVPNEKVGLIIGKRGIAIRDLQLRSGAKIQVTKDDSSVQNGSRPVTITGTRPQVEDAKAFIAEKINVPYLPPSSAPPQLSPPPRQPLASSGKQTSGIHLHSSNPNSQSIPYGFTRMYDADFSNNRPSSIQGTFEASHSAHQQPSTTIAYYPYMGYGYTMSHNRQYPSALQPGTTSNSVSHGMHSGGGVGSNREIPGPAQIQTIVPHDADVVPTPDPGLTSSADGGHQTLVSSTSMPRTGVGAIEEQNGNIVNSVLVASSGHVSIANGGAMAGGAQNDSNGDSRDLFSPRGFSSVSSQKGGTQSVVSSETLASKRPYASGDISQAQPMQGGECGNIENTNDHGSYRRKLGSQRLGDGMVEKPVHGAIREQVGSAESVVENGEG